MAMNEFDLEEEPVCPNCGQNTDGESFCPNCGAVIDISEGEDESYSEDSEIDYM